MCAYVGCQKRVSAVEIQIFTLYLRGSEDKKTVKPQPRNTRFLHKFALFFVFFVLELELSFNYVPVQEGDEMRLSFGKA